MEQVAKSKVLFLCTGNSARSQMAEALLRAHAGEHFNVHSAGLDPKGVNPYTIQVMDEAGIDISAQESKSVKVYMGREQFDFVITVCSDADENCPQALWSRGVKLHWPFDDPAAFKGDDAAILNEFRRIRDDIAKQVKAWTAETIPT